ncbi:hypothetical protein ACIRJS_32340 [Streptomyces sp. NPDC102340]|uniref:hypothetical protein n=1 Tax=unclassified Streptomyces TaxID=2593676 RepID=UPI00380AFAD7
MPPSPVRRWCLQLPLLVPLLVFASAALLAAHFSFDGDTYRNCRYLGPSTRMYVTAWAAPVCGSAAVVLLLALRRVKRWRGGERPGETRETWRGRRVAVAAVCLVPVLLLVQLAALYWVYATDPAGGQDCSGLTVAAHILR